MTLHMRRGSAVVAEETIFGPLLGAQWVRDHAVPGAVTVFPGTAGTDFTQLNPANSQSTNQAAITNDTTTKVWWPKGSYATAGTGFNLKPSQEHRLEAPAGTTRSATNSAVLPASGSFAMQSQPGGGETVKGGLIQSATSYGIVNNGPTFTLEDSVLELCSTGILLQSNNVQIRRCCFRNNTRYGLSQSSGANALVELCEIDNNNTAQNNPELDAGGCKFGGEAVTFRSNWSHNNYGMGFWADYAFGSHIVEENVCENNGKGGIFYEKGTGDEEGTASALIRRNYCKNNGSLSGFAAQQIIASRCDGVALGGTGFEIYLNYLDQTDGFGAALYLHDTVSSDETNKARVHDNDVWMRGSALGICGATSADSVHIFSGAADNQFTTNHYHVPNTSAARWLWNGVPGGTNKTFSQWQALGKDTAGSVVLI